MGMAIKGKLKFFLFLKEGKGIVKYRLFLFLFFKVEYMWFYEFV